MKEFRGLCDFKIFDVVEVLFWRNIAPTNGHVTCLLEIQHVTQLTRVLTAAHSLTATYSNVVNYGRKNQTIKLASFDVNHPGEIPS